MNIKQGEIYLVNFDPSYGHEYYNTRPALIVESNKFITLGNLITLIPISSKTDKKGILDVYLSKDDFNRMHSDSLIKTSQISTFDKRRLIHRIGTCDFSLMKEVKSNIDNYLEFIF